jgi:hypothetical protein
MGATSTAKRRRKQARNGYRHMGPMVRPRYKVRDASTAARRERLVAERRRELIMRGVKVR